MEEQVLPPTDSAQSFANRLLSEASARCCRITTKHNTYKNKGTHPPAWIWCCLIISNRQNKGLDHIDYLFWLISIHSFSPLYFLTVLLTAGTYSSTHRAGMQDMHVFGLWKETAVLLLVIIISSVCIDTWGDDACLIISNEILGLSQHNLPGRIKEEKHENNKKVIKIHMGLYVCVPMDIIR